MKLIFEISQEIAEGSSPSVVHNSDNTANLIFTDKEGLIQEYSTETPLGTWTDRTFLKVGRASGEIGATNIRMKNIPNYKTIYTWKLDDILRIAVSPDSIPMNTTNDPFRLFYAIDKEKLYMNIAQQWEYIATKNHGSMEDLDKDSHPQYLTSERHEDEPHRRIEEKINLLKLDVVELQALPPGQTDLRGYYTKEEVDELLKNFSPSGDSDYINWAIVGSYATFNLATKELIRTNTTTGYDSGGYYTIQAKKGISFKFINTPGLGSASGTCRVGLVYDYTKDNAGTDADGRIFNYNISIIGDSNKLQFMEGSTKVFEIESWMNDGLEFKIEVDKDNKVNYYHNGEFLYTSPTLVTGAPLYPKARLWGESKITEAKIY